MEVDTDDELRGISIELETPDCTLTQGYWKTHNMKADVPTQQEPWPIAESTKLCGMSWLGILHTEPNGDPWTILAHQYIAAMLNVANGASTTLEVDAAIKNATVWVGACAIPDAEHEAALITSQLLDAYNNGEIGPGHCE